MAQRIVDLTHPIHEGMPTFPVNWHPEVEATILEKHGIENRETRKLVLGTPLNHYNLTAQLYSILHIARQGRFVLYCV
ncbi:hypothetical protein ACFLWL_03285 [Chloroflexota bacterium]